MLEALETYRVVLEIRARCLYSTTGYKVIFFCSSASGISFLYLYQQRPLTLCHKVYKFLAECKEHAQCCALEEEFLLGKFWFGGNKQVERSLEC